jgi:hypothetical protein
MKNEWNIDVFYGELSPQIAHIYARCEELPGGQEWTIVGRVRGPECRYAHTLPTNHSFTDLGAGTTLLARAFVPDPCFWSPDLPALYRVSLEVRRRTANGGEEIVHRAERELGLRWLGTRGGSFYLEGKRWVLRGVSARCVFETPLSEWRSAGAAMLVNRPSDELCREAGREGVLLVPYTVPDQTELRRLSQWASVGIAGGVAIAPDSLRSSPNLILAGGDLTGDVESGSSSHTRFVNADRLVTDSRLAREHAAPVIAVRRREGIRSLDEARAEVDFLQRDLAPFGDFAGYVIDAAK